MVFAKLARHGRREGRGVCTRYCRGRRQPERRMNFALAKLQWLFLDVVCGPLPFSFNGSFAFTGLLFASWRLHFIFVSCHAILNTGWTMFISLGIYHQSSLSPILTWEGRGRHVVIVTSQPCQNTVAPLCYIQYNTTDRKMARLGRLAAEYASSGAPTDRRSDLLTHDMPSRETEIRETRELRFR